ncbi:histidinol-phosphatase [Stella sp.]|uniref:histidinol-phosphatase n=1 Tax=Stella sp. TaxID=2912054 RepID=UPI0035B0537E
MTAASFPAGALALAGRLADAAGAVIRPHFRSGVAIDDKADESPVTIADRDAETAMRRLIGDAFPDHGILGEEHGAVRLDAEFVWVLDPIDGTKAFISGVPVFGTLIALLQGGRPVLGVIDQPISGERWLGAEGHGTTLNGRPVRARACDRLDRATLFATSPDMFKGAEVDAFERLRRSVKLMRWGTDCYATAMVASGHADLVVESSLQPYDFCALVPVIEGAGGIATDWDGRPLRLGSGKRSAIAGDVRAHAAALECLAWRSEAAG